MPVRAQKSECRCAGSGNFGVIIVGSGSADDAVRTLNIFARCPIETAMPFAISSSVETEAFISEPEICMPHAAQHQPQRAHGNAADADQVRVSAGFK